METVVSTPGITTLIYLAISPSLPLAKNISYKLNGSKRFHRVIRVFSYDGIFFFDIFVELLSSLLFASSLFFHPSYPTHPCDRRVFVEESLRLIKRKKSRTNEFYFHRSSPSLIKRRTNDGDLVGHLVGGFCSFGLSDGKAETRCTSRESNKPWKLGSKRASANLPNNASKLSKGVVGQGVCKNWNRGQGEIYPFVPEIGEFVLSISSFRSFFPTLFLPPPMEFPPRCRCYYQNSKRTFLFFFFLSSRMKTRKKASMLI